MNNNVNDEFNCLEVSAVDNDTFFFGIECQKKLFLSIELIKDHLLKANWSNYEIFPKLIKSFNDSLKSLSLFQTLTYSKYKPWT